jgi:DNA-binding SARP family transcriptional activator
VLRLNTFGGLYLDTGSGAGGGRGAQRRRLALLARLAAARGAPVSRDKLVALFWPEHDTASARHALAQAVYEIRRTLGDAALGGLASDLHLDARVVASDVAEFEDALERGDLDRAVALYRGPFLDGVFVDDAPEFERWAEGERVRLARRCRDALEALARAAAEVGDAARAAQLWNRVAELEPLDTTAALSTMRAMAAAVDIPGALRAAARHTGVLRAELDMPPDPDVEALATRLRAQAVSAAPEPGSSARPAPARRAGTPAPPRTRRAAVPLVAGVLLMGALGVASQLRSGVDDARPRPVVLGSVASNDPALGLAIREALRAELDATPQVRVLTDAGLREALRLMGVPGDTTVTGELAVEVAQRRGIPLAVVGSAAAVGDGAAITVQVFDARTGRVVTALSADPRAPDEVLDAVSRLSRTVRERVTGMPLDTLVPLPLVTTTSLLALRSYVLARAAAGAGDRGKAIELAEAALVHDSAFALAHYLLGDLLWFADAQRRSEYHLAEAFRLSGRLPPRERLIVRARYEQLITDRPDSALVTWRRLRGTYPDDPHAPEGMSWVYRALGDFPGAAAAADTAMQLDAGARTPNASNRLHSLLSAGDTTAARAAVPLAPHREPVVELFAALMREDFAGAEQVLRRREQPGADPHVGPDAYWWQILELTRGRLPEAERAMAAVVYQNQGQAAPRALLAQAQAELAFGGSAEHAAALAREAFAWIRRADLSPPAYARLGERIADVAARTGDREMLSQVQAFLRRQDGGRRLRTYRLAEEAIDAFRAYAAGDFRAAATLARRAREETYFWRTISILLLLEADALAASGDREAAAGLNDWLRAWPIPLDADYETWPVLRAVARRGTAP